MRRATIAGLVLLVVGMPLAAGQVPSAETTVDVALPDFPSDPITVRSDSSTSADITVNLHAENFACSGEGTLPVEATLDASPGAPDEFTLDPTGLNFPVPEGTYSGANPYNESMTTTFTVTVNGTVTENHTHEPTVNAEFLPGEVQNCDSTGGFPDASASDSLTVNMVADQTTDGGGTDGGGDDGGATDGGGDTGGTGDGGGIPGPGAAAAAAALLVGARAAGKRRE
jgi:hypothetical protein